MSLAIGDVAKRTSCSVPTVRYYEQIGLLAPAVRAANGRRIYGWPDVSRLRFIRRARHFGMSIDQIRLLLTAMENPEGGCAPAKSIISAKLNDVAAKRAELAALESALSVMLARCDADCGPQSSCCTIFEDIDRAEPRS